MGPATAEEERRECDTWLNVLDVGFLGAVALGAFGRLQVGKLEP